MASNTGSINLQKRAECRNCDQSEGKVEAHRKKRTPRGNGKRTQIIETAARKARDGNKE